MESPWNTIIINQIPLHIDETKLFSLFPQYGKIVNTYLCKDRLYSGIIKDERMARITFRDEDSAWKVWEDSKNKLIKYDDHVMTITVVSDDYSPIQNLPDTCLQEIFRRVDRPRDKLNVEMVCKRWKANGRSTWSSLTEIRSNKFSKKTWSVILNRVRKLKSIVLSLHPLDEERILNVLAKYCKNLERLGITFKISDQNPIDYKQVIRKFRKFIDQNENLRRMDFSVWIHCHDNAVMTFMKAFPAGLVEIHIHVHEQTFPPTVALSKFKNLRILTIHQMTINDHRSIDDLVTLERLALWYCEVPDSVFSTIIKNNKGLKHLDILTRLMSDEVFSYVQKLEKLQILILSAFDFNCKNLSKMSPALKGLILNNSDLKEEELREFFSSAHLKIERLCLKHSQLTSKFVSIAREWTERTGKFLELSIIREFSDKYPDFEIEHTDRFKVIGFEGKIHKTSGNYWGSEVITSNVLST